GLGADDAVADVRLDHRLVALAGIAEAAATGKLQHQAVALRDDVDALVLELLAAPEPRQPLAAGPATVAPLRGEADAVEGGGRDREGGVLAVGDLDDLGNAATELAGAA